jgi:UDP-glucuronate 4-epimerase
MKILVTGCAGFIGSFAAQQLAERGDRVIGVDSLNDYYDVNLKKARLERLVRADRFTFEHADLCDNDRLKKIFEVHQIEAVLHLAAQAGVRYSLVNPAAYATSNLLGFTNVLEASRQHRVHHFVYASTSSVYGGNAKLPFSEHDGVDHPVSFYAATKKANELMAHSYSHVFRLPTTGLRFFTVYGPWGRPDMSPMLFAKAILEGTPIQIFNHGQMTRDFTYIDDVVDSVVRVLDIPATPDRHFRADAPDSASSNAPYRIYNVGNENPVTLLDYVETLERVLGRSAEKIMMPMQAGDVRATHADVSLLKAAIGDLTTTSLSDGLARFGDWFRQYYGYASA